MDNPIGQTDASGAQAGQAGAAKRSLIRLLVTIAGCVLFFGLVSPSAVPLVMLVVGFIMLGVLLYSICRLILVLTGLQYRLRPLQRRAIILLCVCLPLLLLMLQSIGQLTVRDTLTLGGLFVVGVFYVFRFGR